jgi:hypothetical protein
MEYFLFGGVTSTSFEIKLKTKDGGPVAVSVNKKSIGTFSGDSDGYYKIKIDQLSPSTTYAVELTYNSSITNFNVSTFSDLNDQGQILKFAAGGSIESNTKSKVFQKIAAKSPKFMMLLGNIHSNKISSDDWTKYEAEYLNGKIF